MNAKDQTKITNRCIRVFISSTFRDMQAERDILIKKIFPQLFKICEERAVMWTEVDLRWGITDEQQAEGKVLPLCLEEIHRCRPYFIGLLGERYGWIPESKLIPADLLQMQPWLKQHIYDRTSVTELEILHGVFGEEQMHGHAYFYFRNSGYVESVPYEIRQDYSAENTEAAGKVAKLKQKIRAASAERVCELREGYVNPEQLGEWILEDFTKLIDTLFPKEEIPDALDQEAAIHRTYGRSHHFRFIGREKLLQRLDEHASTTCDKPLVLTGESGFGKSSLLAKWADQWREQHPSDLVIEHYVGASPDSTNTIALLTRVLKQVRRDIGFEGEVPSSSEDIKGWFGYFLNEASRKRPFILIIDGVGDVDHDPKLPDLEWLPHKFPSNCHVILSVGSGHDLELLEKRNWPVLRVNALDYSERRFLLVAFLESCGKTLPQNAIEKIIASPNTGNPLFLTWLLEELRCVGQYVNLTTRLEECLRTDGLDGLLELIVRRWLLDYSENCDLAYQSLNLLLASHDGLSENELLSIITTSDGKPVPRAKATPFLLAAEQILARSGHLLHIRRGIMEKVIRKLSQLSRDAVVDAHRRLVTYFYALDDKSDRKLHELPHHLSRTGQWEELHDFLVRPSVLGLLVDYFDREFVNYWEQLHNRFDPTESYRSAWGGWRSSHPRDRDWAHLSSAAGKALYLLGKSEFSINMFREAAEVIELVDGNQSESYANAAKTLGVALYEAGHGQESVAWLRLSLDLFRRIIGVYNPVTFSVTTSLAGCLCALGDYATAEPLLRQVISASNEILGFRAPTTLAAMNNLAEILQRRHALVEAESLRRQVLEVLRLTTSEDNPILLTAINNLGGTLAEQGNLDEAEICYREALTGRTRVLGEKHPDTVQSIGNLAKLLDKKGDICSAENLFKRALAIIDQEQISNPLNWAVISLNYSILLAKKGELSAAEERGRYSLAKLRSALPPDHPYLLRCTENLAMILLQRNDLAGAEMILREADNGYLRTDGSTHHRIQATILALASIYVAQGERETALSLLQEHGMIRHKEDKPPSESQDSGVSSVPAYSQSIEVDRLRAAFDAVLAANSYDDIYAALERFGFLTSTNFISHLEELAAKKSSEACGVLLERVAVLRHLAAGKPLSAESNPVSEAFAAMRLAKGPDDERMLLRLYPFLLSSVVLKEIQRMANCLHDTHVTDMVARIVEHMNKLNSQSNVDIME